LIDAVFCCQSKEEVMARISIDINTDSNEMQSEGKKLRLDAASQVGLLSSVPIVPTFQQSTFNIGLGSAPQVQDNAGYPPGKIRAAKNTLVSQGCTIIAAAGGSVVHGALSTLPTGNMPPFLSIVGEVPTVMGNCRGGVSLESIAANTARINYLLGLGYTMANIYLYTNKNSAIHSDEKTQWKVSGGSDATFLESKVGDGNGNNDKNQFATDFSGSGVIGSIATAKMAIIVSDDPYFQTNQTVLVPLFNTWLSASRQVVYPSQRYANYTGNSTIIGPDLTKAYIILGALSASLLASPNSTFGWIKLASDTFPPAPMVGERKESISR
jgi:hypothetical protein